MVGKQPTHSTHRSSLSTHENTTPVVEGGVQSRMIPLNKREGKTREIPFLIETPNAVDRPTCRPHVCCLSHSRPIHPVPSHPPIQSCPAYPILSCPRLNPSIALHLLTPSSSSTHPTRQINQPEKTPTNGEETPPNRPSRVTPCSCLVHSPRTPSCSQSPFPWPLGI